MSNYLDVTLRSIVEPFLFHLEVDPTKLRHPETMTERFTHNA
jgi:hypothetical protein